jgi:hypothetical protein
VGASAKADAPLFYFSERVVEAVAHPGIAELVGLLLVGTRTNWEYELSLNCEVENKSLGRDDTRLPVRFDAWSTGQNPPFGAGGGPWATVMP